LGINGRLETLQAAVLLSKIEIFDEELAKRAHWAKLYTEKLSNTVKKPIIKEGNTHVFAQYTIASPHRTAIEQQLKAKNIPYAIHYPLPLHKQPAFQHLDTGQSLLNSEKAASQVLSLPFHPYLDEDTIDFIAHMVNHAIEQCH
jgi:UDP-2-acetamido-2-deoxy-ribo-hexuluronate aminotransferase